MRVLLDETGRILESSPLLKEGLNILGPLHGRATSSFELEPVSSQDQLEGISPCRIDAAGPLAYTRKGRLLWAAPDITASRDLFYAKTPAGAWLLEDDFFRIAREFRKLTLTRDIFLYFVQHGYLPPGKTFFEEIRRVRVGTQLTFGGPMPREEDVWQEPEHLPRTYEGFKRAFSSVFAAYPFGEQAAISLSAGSDSGLLAALAVLKYGKRPLAITLVNPNQPLEINDIDAANAGRITRHLDLEHAVLEFDFNKMRADNLRGVVCAMPLAAQLSLHHFLIGEEAARKGMQQLWHGQSADSAYNLGPTQRSWGGPLRRFYFAKEYWQGFPDITGNKLVGAAARTLGALGPIAWRLAHKQALRQPTSFRELMTTFADSEQELPLPARDSKRLVGFARKLSTRQAREEFFAWKAQAFLVGRDPRIRYVVADHYGFESVLPYTAANMLQFFRGLETGWRDIFTPKRFIYRYLEELLGRKAYAELYIGQEKRVSRVSPLTWAQWQEDVLTNTVLGKELVEAVRGGGVLRRIHREGERRPASIQQALGPLWIQHVLSEIEEAGTSVHIS